MPQVYKSCVYNNCNSKRIINGDIGVTLFKFPKDPKRRELWRMLGNVPINTPERLLYMCSKHFDRKFMSVNNRRTLLVGLAVPFPSEKLVKNIASPEKVMPTKIQEMEGSGHILQCNNQIDIVCIEQLNDSLQTTPSPETNNSNDALIDQQNVSKLICNGTVYVKMRLDYYKREKQIFLEKINRYEQIIENIRNDVEKVKVTCKT